MRTTRLRAEARSQKLEARRKAILVLGLLLASRFSLLTSAQAQQLSTQTAPLFAVNAQYVQGVAPGYWPTAGAGLVLNIAAGTAICHSAPTNYAGDALTLAPSATNYVYLDPAANCAPIFINDASTT